MEHKRHDSKHRENNHKQSFTVRTMEIDDLAEVYYLGEEVFKPDLWPMLYRSWDEYEVTTLYNTDGEYCLVAENDDEESDQRIVGFILGTVIAKGGTAWNYGYVIWLCAHPDWQREGVASKLVDKLVETMIEEDGIRIMMADTDPENVKAVKFFRKKGFSDEKPHVYLSTNLEHNALYSSLIHASREAALDAEYLRRIRRLAEDKPPQSVVRRRAAKRKGASTKPSQKSTSRKVKSRKSKGKS
jgi:ribosomal protein S18 acetylase RimI-like enzyme